MQPLTAVDLASEAIAAPTPPLSKPTPIAVDLEPDLVMIGDGRPGRAVVNLLINAWKYSGDDKRITCGPDYRRAIEISVEDNVGIDHERADLFEGFIRVAASRAGRPGSGSVVIVRAVAPTRQGRCGIDARQGSVFRILPRLPRRATGRCRLRHGRPRSP
jgi:signal transduction histidine kinase